MGIEMWIYSFLFCGVICLIGQIVYEYTKLTPGHICSLFVIVGILLETGGAYDFIIDNVGGGALTPITSFGHNLAHAALEGAKDQGFLGILKGLFKNASAVITTVVVLGVICSIIFKPKPQ